MYCREGRMGDARCLTKEYRILGFLWGLMGLEMEISRGEKDANIRQKLCDQHSSYRLRREELSALERISKKHTEK